MSSEVVDPQASVTGARLAGLYLPPEASVFTRLRVAYRAVRVLEQAPDDPLAGSLVNASLDGDKFRLEAARLAETEAGRALLSERPALHRGSIELGPLSNLAEGTVGRAYAQYYTDNGILPFESPYTIRDDGDYLMKWYRETHDLHHIVTGYGTDPVGEMELQAFVLGNLGLRQSAFILAVAALLRPQGLPPVWRYWRRLRAAYARGKRANNLFSVRYDEYFEQTTNTLKAALNIGVQLGAGTS